MNTFTKLSVSALLLASAAYAQSANITLEVSNIKVTEGSLLVAVFSSEASYNQGGEPVAYSQVPATSKSLSIDFPELADGEYAIKLYHDENSNGKLDTNFVGIPTEGYGFSNNGGRFGPPSFADARFGVSGNTALTIFLR